MHSFTHNNSKILYIPLAEGGDECVSGVTEANKVRCYAEGEWKKSFKRRR